MSIPFGTDGWRGVIADDCTFDALRRVAVAASRVYAAGAGPGDHSRIVIGYDTRFLSPEFASAVAELFSRAGIDVLLANSAVPTPVVSFHVHRLGLSGGVAITASHNPAHYNGFKMKAHFGGSAPPALYDEISREADRPALEAAVRRIREPDLRPYRERVGSLLDPRLIRPAARSAASQTCTERRGTCSDVAGSGPRG